MKQKYFGVSNEVLQLLHKNIEEYNLLLKDTYNKEVPKDERLKIMISKEKMEEKIRLILEEEGDLLGFFNEQDAEKLSKEINSLSNILIKNCLNSNILELDDIGRILVNLVDYVSVDVLKKLIILLENAKQDNKSIIVWIM